jgi:FMN phosphatase YigB (HAD superfamily)
MSPLDLCAFDAVLLDMNGTFMFGHDRFGDDQDYGRTYRRIGGCGLDGATVASAVSACCEDMEAKYDDPAWHDRFPSVRDVLWQLSATSGLPPAEVDLIAAVIACHELGDVSDTNEQVLRQLSSTHRLGVVSNLWSDKRSWMDLFEKRDIAKLFTALVFSSDGSHIKPSPALFKTAMAVVDTEPVRILFVGDDPICDIAGAAALGMKTALVGDRRVAGIKADWYLSSVADLVQPE